MCAFKWQTPWCESSHKGLPYAFHANTYTVKTKSILTRKQLTKSDHQLVSLKLPGPAVKMCREVLPTNAKTSSLISRDLADGLSWSRPEVDELYRKRSRPVI